MDFFKERISPYLTIVIVLLFTGLSIQPIKNKLINYNTSTISVESLKAAIGAGAVFETLGGYKSLASDAGAAKENEGRLESKTAHNVN